MQLFLTTGSVVKIFVQPLSGLMNYLAGTQSSPGRSWTGYICRLFHRTFGTKYNWVRGTSPALRDWLPS